MHRTNTILALAASGLFTAIASGQNTVTVCASGCDFTSINAAINASSDGDVIQLSAETYYEGSSVNIGDDKTLRGEVDDEGRPVSVIDGQNQHRGIYQSGSPANLENLIVQNCIARTEPHDPIYGGGIWSAGVLSIENCTIRNNSGRQPGLYKVGGTLNMKSCLFEGNSGRDCLSAYGGSINISYCDFRNNTISGSGGPGTIRLFGSGAADIRNSYIRNNAGHGLVNTFPDFNTRLTDVNICGNSPDVYQWNRRWHPESFNVCWSVGTKPCDQCPDIDLIPDTDGDGVPDSLDACPGFDDTFDSDTDGTPDCLDGCPNDATKDDPGTCGCGVADRDTDLDGVPDCTDPCPDWPYSCSDDGTTIVVTVGQSIQAAIDAAPVGGTVAIAGGTFNQHSLTTAGKAVVIQGTRNPDQTLATTVDALQLGTVFEFQDAETNETIVKDLIVTGGQATWGGGIHIENASPTIEYCVITQNTAANNGGGIHCTYSEAVIRHCEITDNFGGSGGGVSNGVGTATTIEDCLITGNVSTWGYGGGLRFAVQSQVNLRNCTIDDNTCTAGAGWGGGLYINNCPAASVVGCTFRNNRAQSGGGFCILGTSEGVIVDGCSFSGNVATSSGGGVYNTSTPTLTDSTLCGNSPEQVPGDYIDGGGNCIVESCEDTNGNGVPDGCDGDACQGDLNADGIVNAADLGIVIGTWGTSGGQGDVNGDGIVNAADLGIVIGLWGNCP